MELAVEKHGPWTFADLDSLPDETGWRFEISEGCLEMSPSADVRHEMVSALLRFALQERIGQKWLVVGPMSVDLHPSYRLPDLVVVDRSRSRGAHKLLRPSEVLLAAEVVSPSSRTRDRVTKPAQYAAAGIPAYWRVETEDVVSITAHVLREGDAAYTEVGTWREGETLEVAEPFAVRIAIDDLVP